MRRSEARRIEVTVTPPSWVQVEQTFYEWAGIAKVRIHGNQQVGQEVTFTIEGTSADVECFKRIVRLNTKTWT